MKTGDTENQGKITTDTIESSTSLDITTGSSAGNDFTINTDAFVVEGDTGNVGISDDAATTQRLRVKGIGTTSSNYGLVVIDSTGSDNFWVRDDGAGYFSGDVTITGSISKGSGTFTIDHPLDPENKLLQHSFVESPEMRNMYYGQVELKNGKAIISLPDWWHPLNGTDKSEFNYQLTCIGGYAQLWISKEVENGQFEISGNKNIKVSWTLSAVRHDAFAEDNRVQVEVDKDEKDKGTYRHAVTDEMKAKNEAKKKVKTKESK